MQYRSVVGLIVLIPALICTSSSLPLAESSPTPTRTALTAPVGREPFDRPVAQVSAVAQKQPAKPPVRRAATPAKPAPKVVPHIAARRPTAVTVAKPSFKFPVPVSVGTATQIITVKASGSYATVVAWQHSPAGWRAVLSTTAARVGANGVVPAAVRRQGTNTTPGGTFTLTEAFGIAASPGSLLPYHRVTSDDWWVEDNASGYYNQLRRASQGGFNTALPESDVNGSERLITHTTAYQYVVVINYNRWPAVHYKGAGIFLHVNGAGSTAGCVSVPSSTLVAMLRWLNPAQHPRVAIA